MALINPAYCTSADLERYLSEVGAEAFAGHTDPTQPTAGVYDDVINRATTEINLYLRRFYTAAALATHEWVKQCCIVLACYHLTLRRGNPAPDSLANDRKYLLDQLKLINPHSFPLDGLALSHDMRPTHDNVTIDRRYQQQKIRVERNNSSDAPSTLAKHTVDYPAVINF